MPFDMTVPQFPAPDPKGKVLVVDDELDIRESLEILLSSEGYSVDQAQNGERNRVDFICALRRQNDEALARAVFVQPRKTRERGFRMCVDDEPRPALRRHAHVIACPG